MNIIFRTPNRKIVKADVPGMQIVKTWTLWITTVFIGITIDFKLQRVSKSVMYVTLIPEIGLNLACYSIASRT